MRRGNVRCPSCGESFYRDEPWKAVCFPCWKQSKRREKVAVSRPADSIPGDMLARLIRLCHPDKHGNNEMSNLATAWLLSLRRVK